MFILFVGFLLGALAVIFGEALAFLLVLDRLSRRKESQTSESQVGRDLDSEQSLPFAYNKKGIIWILDSEEAPKVSTCEVPTKVPKEQKSKKEIVEVIPIKKHAKIKNHSLILTDLDGSQATTIQLAGCIIVAVSASNLFSRKWAKRYPIRVENKKSKVYNGSQTFYIYVDTSWEKESWCKALRLASCEDKERANWYSKLNEEFHHYLASLNAEYPLFSKSFKGIDEPTDKVNKVDGSSSKVRLFLKKLAKRASNRTGGISSVGREERKGSEKMHLTQDTLARKKLSSEKSSSSFEDEVALPVSSALTHSASQIQSQGSVFSDADCDEKFGNDEGTLCCNLLFSRLFFDAKRSTELNGFIHARIQKTLSNMRTPSYVGGITCKSLDLGNLPPYIHSMRVLPMDMNEVWAVEVDIEYSGGIILDIETRLKVRDPNFQKGIVNTSLDPSSAVEVTTDILEGFEQYGNQLKLSREAVDMVERRDEDDKLDGMKNSKSTSWTSTYVSRWKSMVNCVAAQVSQVPLSLTIRVASLRGTLRLHIKPPPSDQLWIGFTSMPEIDLNLESSVGDHKITSGHVALVIGNRFKAAIRETLVLPNCENVCVPWMLAEKDDWVPRNVAPFIWLHQETCDPAGRDASNKESRHSSSNPTEGENTAKLKDVISSQRPPSEPSSESVSSSRNGPSSNDLSIHRNAVEDLRVPLLESDETQESNGQSGLDNPEYSSRAIVTREVQAPIGEDMKAKKIGRRARMMDLGKKMSEKLEEKKRHIEERSRHIVDKMRGHDI
ncbi:uncharacterized protein LOC143855161 [Tasmannia lanceolata]|uniref:uncharacterized protein LOC143855161 n=1 Tax=Tasmannia lanceolata TaxID=3420 RepID=UPI004063741F